jgi:hypothetical protein
MTLLIENPCYGIGDAVVYAWVCHNLIHQGVKFKYNPYRHHGLIYMLGVPMSHVTTEEGPRHGHPPKGVKGGKDWLRCWIEGYGGDPDRTIIPPQLVHDQARRDHAERWWTERDVATKTKGKRVLIFPQVAWPSRSYPDSSFKWLAHRLMGAGANVVVSLPQFHASHEWPWAYGGMSLEEMVWAIRTADLVISADTGPAHVAGTVGTKAIVLVGPSPFDLFYGWYKGVEAIDAGMPCVGCNWNNMSWCESSKRPDGGGGDILAWEGCTAMKSISPQRIFERALAILDGKIGTLCPTPLTSNRALSTT